jgi:exonuclease III
MTVNKMHNHNTLKILSINSGGLTQQTELEIRQLMHQEHIQIALIQETKKTNISPNSSFQTYTQSGYSTISLTHPKAQHGLQTWINTNLAATFLEKSSNYNSNLEYITVRLHQLIIVNIYRKHTFIQPALDELDHLLTYLQNKYPQDTILLAGDFNATIVATNQPALAKHKRFTQWFKSTKLTNASNNYPTRKDPRTQVETSIDHALLLPTSHFTDELYLPPFHQVTSDHRPIIISLTKSTPTIMHWKKQFNWKPNSKI